MAFSITKKVVVGAISAIILSGTTGVIYSQFPSVNSIKEELIKRNKTPLDLTATSGEDYEHLQELAKQYFNGKPSGKEKIEGLTLNSATDTEPLRKICLTLLDKKSHNKDLSNAENWCTKESAPRKISTLLDKKGKVLLNGTDSTNWNKSWKKFQTKYKDKKPTWPWNIKKWDEIKENSDTPNEFKNRCASIFEVSLMPNTKEKLLLDIEKFCTKQKDA